MIDPYTVRETDKGYAIFDSRVNGFRSELDLDEKAAIELAAQMNADEAKSSPSDGVRDSRKVHPPRRVLIRIGEKWWTGSLDMWVREVDGWYGKATLDADGPTNWYPSKDLRPASG